MLNPDVNALTKQLEELRLERTNDITHLKRINKADIQTLLDLEEAKDKTSAQKRGVCPFVKGDVLRITNRLRGEYRTVGMARKFLKHRSPYATVAPALITRGPGTIFNWWNHQLLTPTHESEATRNRFIIRISTVTVIVTCCFLHWNQWTGL